MYPGTCREKIVRAHQWRDESRPLRLRLPDDAVDLCDRNGNDCSQTPAQQMGDPIIRRRDGAFSYHLVVTVDDAHAGVTTVVRGMDLLTSTATQVLIQNQLRPLLAWPQPYYRHHPLLLEERSENTAEKFAKLHGSVSWRALNRDASIVRGDIAALYGLIPEPEPLSVDQLLDAFSWERMVRSDIPVKVDEAGRLRRLAADGR